MKKISLMTAMTVLVLGGCASEGILPTATAPVAKTDVSAISAPQGVGKAVEAVLVEKPAVVTSMAGATSTPLVLATGQGVTNSLPTTGASVVPLAPTLEEQTEMYDMPSSVYVDTSVFKNSFLYRGVFNGQSVGVSVGPAVSSDDLKRSTVRAALDTLEKLGFYRVSQQDYKGALSYTGVSADEIYYRRLPSTCDGCSRENMLTDMKRVLNDATKFAVFIQRTENITENYTLLSSTLRSVFTLRKGWKSARLSVETSDGIREVLLSKENPVFVHECCVNATLVSAEVDDTFAPSSLDYLSDFFGVYTFSKEYNGRVVRWRVRLSGNQPEAVKQILNLLASKGFRREELSSENIDVNFDASTGPYWYGASSRVLGYSSNSGTSTDPFDLKTYFNHVEAQISKVEGQIETSAAVGVRAYTVNGDGLEKYIVFEFSSRDGKPHVGTVTFSSQSRDRLGEYSISSPRYNPEESSSFIWGNILVGYYDRVGRPTQLAKTSNGTILVPGGGVAKIEFPVRAKSGVFDGGLTISIDSLRFAGKEYPVSDLMQVL